MDNSKSNENKNLTVLKPNISKVFNEKPELPVKSKTAFKFSKSAIEIPGSVLGNFSNL